jgi:L-demethylnoviosyl transferase
MRVLFTTAPLHGHFFPLVPLAWACRALGHDVLVATSEHFVPTAVRAGLPAVSGGPGIQLRELADPDAVHGIEDARYAHGLVFALMASRNLAGTVAIVETWQPHVVVAERAELAGPIAAASLGIPVVELQWGVAELPEYRMAGLATLRPWLRRFGLAELPTPRLVLNPWPPSLRLSHATGHHNLRHVAYNGQAAVSGWLFQPADRPRISLTLGTVLPHLARPGLTTLVVETVHRLAQMECELVLAVDDEIAAGLGPLPAAVRHAGRIPLAELLHSSTLLIHHGGQGTALTALAAGCPQVVLPKFDDQIENADAVARSGAGLLLPLDELTPDGLTTRCRAVLDDPTFGTSAAEVAAEISAQPSPVEVATALTRVAAGDPV